CLTLPAARPSKAAIGASAQGQHRLEAPIAALLGRAAGSAALHHEQLAKLRLPSGTIGRVTTKGRAFVGIFAARPLPRFAGGLPRPCCLKSLLDDAFGLGGVFFEIRAESVGYSRLDGTSGLGRTELCLRLPFKLWVVNPNAQNARASFAHVFACQILLI